MVVAAGTPHGKEITWVDKWNYDAVYTAIQFMDFMNNDQNTYRMPHQNFVIEGKGRGCHRRWFGGDGYGESCALYGR